MLECYPARSSTRHSARTNMFVRYDAVLNLDQPQVHITNPFLTGFVRHNWSIYLDEDDFIDS